MVTVSPKEIVELMDAQPIALRKKITHVLAHSIVDDYDAVNWIDGTPASRKEAVRKMIEEALASGVTPEEVKLRAQGVNYLLLCLSEFIRDSKDIIQEITDDQ